MLLESPNLKPTQYSNLQEVEIIEKFISSDDVVLELGAPSWGKSTRMISSIVNDYSLIACECSEPFSIEDSKKYKFHVFDGFITDKIVYKKKERFFAKNFKKETVEYDNLWSTDKLKNSYIFKDELDSITNNLPEIKKTEIYNKYFLAETMKFKDIQNKYNLIINTLVLDCEGGFYDLLKNSENILQNIKKIIIEWDAEKGKCYEIRKLLFEKGFISIYQNIGWAEKIWHPFNIGHEVFVLKSN